MKIKSKYNFLLGGSAAFGCETLYGLSYIFTKQATNSASSLALLGWRFLIAFIVMSILIVLGIVHVDFSKKKLVPLFLVGLFNPVLYFVGETFGISNTTASESGVLLACIPVAALLASTIFLHKRPNNWQVIGIMITLVGVIFTVLSSGVGTSFSIIGYLFLVIAVISYAIYSVLVEKATSYTEFEITYTMLAIGMVVFVALASIESLVNGQFDELLLLPIKNSNFLIAILYQGIASSVAALFLSNFAIARIGVNQSSSFIGVSTVVSIIAGVLILGEHFNFYQTLGAIVILLGVYVANRRKNSNSIQRNPSQV